MVSAVRTTYGTIETTGRLSLGEMSCFAPRHIGGTREIFFKPHSQIQHTALGYSVSLGVDVQIHDIQENMKDITELTSEHLSSIFSTKGKKADGEEVVLVTHDESVDKYEESISRLTTASSHTNLLKKPGVGVILPQNDAILTDSSIPTMIRSKAPSTCRIIVMLNDLKVLRLSEDLHNPYKHSMRIHTLGCTTTSEEYISQLGLNSLNIEIIGIHILKRSLERFYRSRKQTKMQKVRTLVFKHLIKKQQDIYVDDIYKTIGLYTAGSLAMTICYLTANIAVSCKKYESSDEYTAGKITAEISMSATDAIFIAAAIARLGKCIRDRHDKKGVSLSNYEQYLISVIIVYLRSKTKYNIFNLAVHAAIQNKRLQNFIADLSVSVDEALSTIKILSMMMQLMR